MMVEDEERTKQERDREIEVAEVWMS